MSDEFRTRVLAHPSVVAAREVVRVAQERQATTTAELDAAEMQARDAGAVLEAAIESGDPDGMARELSRAVRAAREEQEDVGHEARAAEAALGGAVASQHRATLAGIGDVWSKRDRDGATMRLAAATIEMAAAVEEVETLVTEHRAAVSWASSLVADRLDGDGEFPPLPTPSTGGLPPAAFRELSAAVRRLAARVNLEEEGK